MQQQDFKALLKDETFINYCFKRNREDVDDWENWIKLNPDCSTQIEELKQLVITLGFHAGNAAVDQNYLLLKERIAQQRTPEKKHLSIFSGWIKYAAAVIILTFSIFLYHKIENKPVQKLIKVTTKDILPGGNKAMLTLADGSRISLTDAAKGKINQQNDLTIVKTADGQLIYSHNQIRGSSANQLQKIKYNTIETPRGGQFRVTLPDGSKAWLNAASSLTYPITFAENERAVKMTGEVYFEIAKDKHRPFLVKTVRQEVKVLGTHFNINAYEDEPVTRTTLIEGSVKIVSLKTRMAAVLKPGERAEVMDRIKISKANIDEELAWKNGDFIFNGENLQSIMRKVARWYDVEVSCPEYLYQLRFDGMVSRRQRISAILHMIESTGKVHFKIEGRRITVLH